MLTATSPAAIAAVLIVMLIPLAWAYVFKARGDASADVQSFLTNHGQNGFVATLSGAVAGNIGIGSFLALFLFANQAPVLAFSIVGAYTLGLFLCGFLAPLIRKRAAAVDAVGLIDLITKTHGSKHLLPIWISMAVVFILRSAVQLGALGFIAASAFGGNATIAIATSAILIGLYLLAGGYRAAVQTDVLQAIVIVIGCVVCAFGLPKLQGTPAPFFSFGEYGPVILIGIWLFIPWSAVLAVDNWQRITLARSTAIASKSYMIAGTVCGCLFLLMAFAGYWALPGADMYDTFEMLSPSGMAWIATAIFVACIMSSIDTFIMPLVSASGRNTSLTNIRLTIIGLIALTASTAILFSDTLDNIIAAFNSLAVFLPVAFGALFLHKPSSQAATASIYAGLISAIAFSFFAQSVASLVGFALATIVYALLYLSSKKVVP